MLLGKRLRSRLILAPLLGQSRHAYSLWQVQQERPILPAAKVTMRILALVESGEGVEQTVASCEAEEIEVQISDAAPESIDSAWVMPIASGDTLARGAGAAYRAAAAGAADTAHLIYADDDLLDDRGMRRAPHFKPDWNAELYRHFDYLTGATLLRVQPADLEALPKGGWATTLTARVAARTTEVTHLHRVLHHRKTRPAPQVPGPIVLSSEELAALPSVSVIVPTRDRHDLLRTCLAGLARTDYPAPLEIIVIDNGSQDPATLDYLAQLDPGFARVLRDDGPFNFAALNNRAVEQASGELLCLLNNDIEITDPCWLMTMAHQAMRADVGAVGAQLLYRDGRVQHAGVVLGVGGGAAHAHRLLELDEEGYFRRHALPQFTSAVTAACLVVQREKFLGVGGFDAVNFPVAFNDVDLCLKLGERGWKTLYEPRARLVHHESVSRGLDRDRAGAARLANELEALQQRWGTRLPAPRDTLQGRAADPFHHPALSPFSERFAVHV